MSLVSILNLSLSFMGKTLFKDIGFQIEPGDRVGLIGPNGAGKTTLLNIIMGEITPESGEIRIHKGVRIGYLPQDVQETSSETLLKWVRDSVPKRALLRREISALEQALDRRQVEDEDEKIRLAARLADLHHQMGDLDDRFPLHSAEKILFGLGFREEDFPRPMAVLSGGWKMRAALGGLLYRNPDLLLLDEPTNHLDLPSVRWLNEYLEDHKGAMILICHDRDFLNRQIKRTLSFEPEGLRSYNGNYDAYLKAREEEQKILEGRARNQEQKVKEARRFIDRFRAKASKARQAQSKIKLVEKIELVQTHQKKKIIRFSFPPVPRSGRDVLNISGVSKGFDGKTLYRDIDLRVTKGDRVAITGINGAGKTTLLRMIAAEMDPDGGRIRLGHGVTMSYFAQHHSEMLNPGRTVIEEVYHSVPHETVGFVRGVCGAFLFSGEDVDKSIGVLSGGERARVSLAKILVNPGNFLVMDEPTNHLDLISSEILIDALADYEGTLLFVSHNQSFVKRLATKIWDLDMGKILEYPGTLDDYYDHLARSEKAQASAEGENPDPAHLETGPSAVTNRQSRKMQRRERAEKRRQISAKLRPIKDRLIGLEEKIDALEKGKKCLEERLADPDIFKDKETSLPLLNEYNGLKERLEGLLARWEYQQDQLDSTKKELGLLEGN